MNICDAAQVCAGVIDWAFSRSAPKDGPYLRDAPNFFGMAAGALHGKISGAVLAPSQLAGLPCSLGGIDQDDYFPINNNTNRNVRINLHNLAEPRVNENVGARVFVLDTGGSEPQQSIEPTLASSSSGTALEFDLAISRQRRSAQGVLSKGRSLQL